MQFDGGIILPSKGNWRVVEYDLVAYCALILLSAAGAIFAYGFVDQRAEFAAC